jgi:hygromycin-B 4-O-kinase
MSTHKTKVDQERVHEFLWERLDTEISDLAFIVGGESSQAFSYRANSNEYIIRVNRSDASFKKDKYAHNIFASEFLPIPTVLEIGAIDDQFFAISEKVPGKIVQQLTSEEQQALIPELLVTLGAIHSTDIAATNGYGKWNAEGAGEAETWKGYLLSLDKYKDSFPEQDVWDQIFGRIKELAERCPEERHLIHGDFGYDNVLSDGTNVTGVIDWGESKYGDLLYDVAWVSFWAPLDSPLSGFTAAFLAYQEDKGITYDNFHDRVRCYELFLGLVSISFYAYSGQMDKYVVAKEKLLGLL